MTGDRAGSELPGLRATELRRVVGDHPRVDGVELKLPLLEPGREALEVEPVRAPGRVGERRGGEKALDGAVNVHPARIRVPGTVACHQKGYDGRA